MDLRGERILNNCQKNRQFSVAIFLALISLSTFIGCGKTTNSSAKKEDLLKIQNQVYIESSCSKSDNHSSVYYDIINLVNIIQNTNTLMYGGWNNSRIFSFESPLEVNELILRKMYVELETQFKSRSISTSLFRDILEYLNRYEAMKCQANQLSKNKDKDLRPYLYFTHKCNQECDDIGLSKIFLNEKQTAIKMLNNLCLSFDSAAVCAENITAMANSNQLSKYAGQLLDRFSREKFEKLFQLKNQNPKHLCLKENEMTKLNLKIFNGGLNSYVFQLVYEQIASTWSKNNFQIIFDEVIDPQQADLKIIPTNGQLSHVNNDDLKTIYLDRNLDNMTIQKVAAHEFGHTLGFPDCYIEFFDSSSVSLIYYELSNDNQNIMCSLKNGVIVLDDYIDQIKSKTCLFN